MPDVDACAYSPFSACAWEESTALHGVDSPVAYAWLPSMTTAVLGLSQKAERELNLDALQADQIPVLRRASGGGAVMLTKGVLCFGALVPPAHPLAGNGIHEAFHSLTTHVCDACKEFGVPLEVAGISDLAARVSDESSQCVKLAGCAQLRKKHAILVHGSLLVDVDRTLFERYLAFPSDIPDYRGSRSHTAFCRSLSDLTNTPLSVDEVCHAIRNRAEQRGFTWHMLPAELPEGAADLLAKKYQSSDWNYYRKRPQAK